ncbi:hypothetical protein HDU96_007166 [Phlyctochytrium bullatum]|nr:hypothetical protein HDU96_007166 [Phlyctochytrium bullatum]
MADDPHPQPQTTELTDATPAASYHHPPVAHSEGVTGEQAGSVSRDAGPALHAQTPTSHVHPPPLPTTQQSDATHPHFQPQHQVEPVSMMQVDDPTPAMAPLQQQQHTGEPPLQPAQFTAPPQVDTRLPPAPVVPEHPPTSAPLSASAPASNNLPSPSKAPASATSTAPPSAVAGGSHPHAPSTVPEHLPTNPNGNPAHDTHVNGPKDSMDEDEAETPAVLDAEESKADDDGEEVVERKSRGRRKVGRPSGRDSLKESTPMGSDEAGDLDGKGSTDGDASDVQEEAVDAMEMDDTPKKRGRGRIKAETPAPKLESSDSISSDAHAVAVKDIDSHLPTESKALAIQGADIVIPSYATWFSFSNIHEIEKKALPEFFGGRNKSKTPQVYKDYRDFIINTYRLNPLEYLTVTACRRNLAGDVCAIIRVHNFLEQWGLINYQVDPDSKPIPVGPSYTGHFRVTADTPRGFQPLGPVVSTSARDAASLGKLPIPHTPLPTLPAGVVQQPQSVPKKRTADEAAAADAMAVDDAASATDGETKPDKAASDTKKSSSAFCRTCGVACRQLQFASTKQRDYHLCRNCYLEGRFPSTLRAADFSRRDARDPDELIGEQAAWTDKEVLMLLEGIEMFADDWDRVADHVGTRNREACVLRFLEMPIEDPFLEEQGESLGPLHYSMYPFSAADNPVLSVLALLASVVKPQVARASAKAAVEELVKMYAQKTAGEETVKAEEGAKAESGAEVAEVQSAAPGTAATPAQSVAPTPATAVPTSATREVPPAGESIEAEGAAAPSSSTSAAPPSATADAAPAAPEADGSSKTPASAEPPADGMQVDGQVPPVTTTDEAVVPAPGSATTPVAPQVKAEDADVDNTRKAIEKALDSAVLPTPTGGVEAGTPATATPATAAPGVGADAVASEIAQPKVPVVERVAATALGAAAAKAFTIAHAQEEEIRSAVERVIELQLQKLELKMRCFQEIEAVVDAEREDLQRQRRLLQVERAAFRKEKAAFYAARAAGATSMVSAVPHGLANGMGDGMGGFGMMQQHQAVPMATGGPTGPAPPEPVKVQEVEVTPEDKEILGSNVIFSIG